MSPFTKCHHCISLDKHHCSAFFWHCSSCSLGHKIINVSVVDCDRLQLLSVSLTLWMFISWVWRTAAVKMLHILETWPTKLRWWLLARKYGTSAPSSLASTVFELCAATRGGWRNPAMCGTLCTCALWNTTSTATSLLCSSESKGLADLGWGVGSAVSTSRKVRRWMLSSFLACEAAPDIYERAAYSR